VRLGAPAQLAHERPPLQPPPLPRFRNRGHLSFCSSARAASMVRAHTCVAPRVPCALASWHLGMRCEPDRAASHGESAQASRHRQGQRTGVRWEVH